MKYLFVYTFTAMLLISNIAFAGITFNDPVMVVDEAGGNCIGPALAINPDLGRLYVVYNYIFTTKGNAASSSNVKITHSDTDGASWSTPFELLSNASNPTVNAKRINGTDFVTVVYGKKSDGYYLAYLSYSTDGGDTYETPLQVSTSDNEIILHIDSAIKYDSSSGKYIVGVAWTSEIDGPGIDGSVRYREYVIDLSGPNSFGTEVDFSTADDHIGYGSTIDIEFDSNGDKHVVFGDYQDHIQDIAYSYNTGSGWSDPEMINDHTEWYQQINANGRGLTIDAGDNLYAAWTDTYQVPYNYFIGDVKPAGGNFGNDFDIDDCGSAGGVVGYGNIYAGDTAGNVTGAWLDRRYPNTDKCFVGETTDTGSSWDRPSILASPGLDPATEYFLRYVDVVRNDSENKVFIIYEVAFENYIKMNVGTRSSLSALKASNVSAVASGGFVNVSWVPEIETGIAEYRIYRYSMDEITNAKETLEYRTDKSSSNYDPVNNMYYRDSYSSPTNRNAADKQPDAIINVNVQTLKTGKGYKIKIAGEIGDQILVEGIAEDGQVYSFSPVTVLKNTENTGKPDISIIPKTAISTFPNPTNGDVSFSFALPSAGNVEIAIYNLKGQKIAEVVNNYYNEGEHSISWKSDLSAGVYLYRLTTSGNQIVSKLAIVK